MAESYPRRPKFFALKFCRVMAKACIANEIGQGGFCLLVVIAHTEDAKGYRGPVTWFNEPLMAMAGFTQAKTFIASRKRAVDAGWLHYEAGSKGKAGKYWVTIPAAHQDWDDSPSDDSSDDYSVANSPQKGKGNANETAIETPQKGKGNANETASHSSLLPVPIPVPKSAAPSGAARDSPNSLFGEPEEKPREAESAKPRPRDELFDAIVEVTGSSAAMHGARIGKTKKALLAEKPPYTPEEVYRFGEMCRTGAECGFLNGRKPSLANLTEYISRVRNPSAAKPPPKRFETHEEKTLRQIGEAIRNQTEEGGGDDEQQPPAIAWRF